ncbi:MAG: preprotein translocase subunit SecE, partial [Betaproteobacteria bacterium]
SWAETKKGVWPTRKETFQTTGIVFLLVVVLAIFLWIVDASLMWAVKLLMGQGD